MEYGTAMPFIDFELVRLIILGSDKCHSKPFPGLADVSKGGAIVQACVAHKYHPLDLEIGVRKLTCELQQMGHNKGVFWGGLAWNSARGQADLLPTISQGWQT
jgi:hypothetical protein